MKRAVGMLTVAMLFVSFSYRQGQASTSQAGVLFLRIAAGARAAGMGESFVALANDATATHWNPAGLGQYPLTATWLDWELPVAEPIEKMALTHNGVPEANYKRFAVWAWASGQLYHWNGRQWQTSHVYRPAGDETLESIVRKYTKISDDSTVAALMEKVAEANSRFTKAALRDWREKVLALLPQESADRTSLANAFDELATNWSHLTVDEGTAAQVGEQVGAVTADGSLTPEEFDKLRATLAHTGRRFLLEEIRLPYNLAFTAPVTALTGEESNLWVGTESGLYRFDGSAWRRFGRADSLASEKITCLAAGPNKTIWIGTDAGVLRTDGRQVTNYDTTSGLPGQPIVALAVKGERLAYAATQDDLYRLDGERWSDALAYTLRVNDTWERVAAGFTGRQDDRKVAAVVKALKEVNHAGDTATVAGAVVRLPYRVALESPITTLEIDKEDHLWIGTAAGLKRFAEGEFTVWGYDWHAVKEGETVQSIAAATLGSTDSAKVALLVEKIKAYNQLGDEPLAAGQKIGVYDNILGSPTRSIGTNGDKILVGTAFGTLMYRNEKWSRYYHNGLDKVGAAAIFAVDGELFFGALNRVVVYAHARREITFMHVNWLPELATDLAYEYLSYVQHVEGWGTLGGNVTFLNLGRNVRTSETGDTLGVFDSFDAALTLSYGTRLTRSLVGGISAKVIYSNLANVGAGAELGSGRGSSVALDFGLLYQTPFPRLNLGLAVTNLGPNITYIDANQSDPLPRNLAFGWAYKVFDTPYNRLTFVGEVNKELVDLNSPRSVELKEAIVNAGLEYWYGSFFALRTGYIYDQLGDIKTPTFGGGLQYSSFRIDFSYIPASRDLALANTLRLSVTGRF